MKVWIVSLEWNHPPSEVTGDSGIVDVFDNEAAARTCQLATKREFETNGDDVYEFSYVAGRYCSGCGLDAPGEHTCEYPDSEEFCDHCGAELNANDSCDNDHDAWDIDIHCREYDVHA
jgi:hypothetical protein